MSNDFRHWKTSRSSSSQTQTFVCLPIGGVLVVGSAQYNAIPFDISNRVAAVRCN